MRRLVGRPTTVRARIVALVSAPALALLALWTFTMVSVTGELRALVRLQGVYEDFGTPVDTAIGQIQIERRLAAAYLGAEHRTPATRDLMEQQRRTDRAVKAMRDAIRDGDRDRLTGRQRQALDAVVAAAGELEGLRQRVLSRAISWDRAVEEYGALVEPGFGVQSALTALQAGQLAREAQVVVELVRVREFVSREDALVAGAHAAGRLTDRQYDTLTATIEHQPRLRADVRARSIFISIYFFFFLCICSLIFLFFLEHKYTRCRSTWRRDVEGARPPTGPSRATWSCAPGRPSTPPSAAGPSPDRS
ncbi:nitrate- and nitrite sensing domain-containing protein [Streptomyces viridosporus]|uniref:nitrate- and nitrite sensing domain-containing protein n=1 Tax=Streptomyces viridosporus TaxID=67581 RepID=UPI0002EC8F7F|nr:nitrate- and nitrite sensing domain-containing protein [Streptomyces viridosporus]